MKIKLYQINHDRDKPIRAYQSLRSLQRLFGSKEIVSDRYDKVFDGEVDCKTLDDVYRKFNLDHPKNYHGRSLSVSDVVEVVEPVSELKKGFYFCDEYSFEKVDFQPEKTQDMSSPDLLTVLYIKPHEPPEIKHIRPELEDMQRLVGGYIERIITFDDEVAIIANEEGKITGLELNRAIYDERNGKRGQMIDVIAGNFFLVNAPYNAENFQSLTPEMIRKYQKRFQYPESFIKLNGAIAVIPETPRRSGRDR